MAKTKRLRRSLFLAGAVFFCLVGGCLVTGLLLDAPIPDGKEGPEADALARQLREGVHIEAWERTLAVRFLFGGRQRFLWDRDRKLVELRWGDHHALFRTGNRKGVVFTEGKRVHGKEARELLDEAYGAWINAAFWLQPFRTFFDEGTARKTVALDGGGTGLLVTYGQGGVTPGDTYLWIPGAPGEPPRAWRLWVSVVPIGGLETTWGDWIELETGALVARTHGLGPIELELISEVEGAETLDELTDGKDPFEVLTR